MKRYKNFYGDTASIFVTRMGEFRLRASISHGIRIYDKTYKTERGAKQAMSRLSEATWNIAE
jgi:hypothetical protein